MHTVYVDTGGSTARGARRHPPRRRAPSARSATMRSTRATQVYDRFVRFLIQGNVLRGEVYPLERGGRADPAGAVGGRGGARGSAPAPSPTAPPARATTRSASTSPCGCSRPSSRSSPPSATLGHQARAGDRLSRAARTAGPGQGRRLLDQPRPLGHHLGRRLDPRHLGRAAGRAGRSAGRRAGAARDRARRGSAGCRSRSTARRSAGPELVAASGRPVRGLRHRPQHPRRRDRARHQGPDRLRGRRRAAADRRAPRAREAGAHQVADVLEGPARPVLRRPPARGPVLRSGAPRHRGADHQLAGSG